MTDQNQTLRDDIAFMRGLAEAGRDRPMLGGAILFACGLIFGGASLVVWWLASYQGLGGLMYPSVWGVAFLLYMAVLFPLLRGLPRTAASAQAASGMAWSGVGWASFFIVASLMLMSGRMQDWTVMWALPSIFMALYGSAWLLAASVWRKGWLRLTAYASFAAALVNAWFAPEGQTVWLLYGLSLFALMAVPGLYIMRQGRAAG